MTELIQFFIETAGISGNHLAGLVVAGVVALGMAMIFAWHITSLIVGLLRNIRPIKINKVEKVDKVVEIPKIMDNKAEYQEIIKRLKDIEKKQGSVQL